MLRGKRNSKNKGEDSRKSTNKEYRDAKTIENKSKEIKKGRQEKKANKIMR